MRLITGEKSHMELTENNRLPEKGRKREVERERAFYVRMCICGVPNRAKSVRNFPLCPSFEVW